MLCCVVLWNCCTRVAGWVGHGREREEIGFEFGLVWFGLV